MEKQLFKIGDVVHCKLYAISKPLPIIAFSKVKRKVEVRNNGK